MAGRSATATRPDLATAVGLLMAVGGILGGFVYEGGDIGKILRPTAALIVFGGTLGAVMITMPFRVLRGAAARLAGVFLERQARAEAVVEEIIGYATRARKSGIVSLEKEAAAVRDPFLRKALNLAVDGTEVQEIRRMMELEIAVEEQRVESEARVFEQGGGYAPTIGIIGAVLGLIQVMQNLENVAEVGRGIATAFVATIYGVGSANIFFLPAANKIRATAHAASQMKELMLEGVCGIAEGLNPKLIHSTLEAYVESRRERGKPAKAPGEAGR